MARATTRAAAVGSRWLRAWATARPSQEHQFQFTYVFLLTRSLVLRQFIYWLLSTAGLPSSLHVPLNILYTSYFQNWSEWYCEILVPGGVEHIWHTKGTAVLNVSLHEQHFSLENCFRLRILQLKHVTSWTRSTIVVNNGKRHTLEAAETQVVTWK
jgi:hypothetical protein